MASRWNSHGKHKIPPLNQAMLKGVYFMQNPPNLVRPWKAYARRHGQQISLGYFKTKWAAAKAYNRWALKTHGPGTYLNPAPAQVSSTIR